MRSTRSEHVTAVCARCGGNLAPVWNGRLRCARLSACGFGGVVEDRASATIYRLSRAFERGFLRPPGPSPAVAVA